MQRRLQRRKVNVLHNYIKKRKALNRGEKIPEFIINQTIDNLVIKMNDGNTNSDENTTKQYKKLVRANERYLADYENEKDNMFYTLFLNDGDDFFTNNMVKCNMVTLIPRHFINQNTKVIGLERDVADNFAIPHEVIIEEANQERYQQEIVRDIGAKEKGVAEFKEAMKVLFEKPNANKLVHVKPVFERNRESIC